MGVADLRLPVRLLAGGGPTTPDPRVLRSLATPLIGQFDPEFTAIMDDVVQLARRTFLSESACCFAVSALASGATESALNSLLADGDAVCVGGSPRFVASVATIVRGCGVTPTSLDELGPNVKLVMVPLIDPWTAQLVPIRDVAAAIHASGARILVDATIGLAACELRLDDWGIDVCVAGVHSAIGGPSGMSLIAYSSEIEAQLAARSTPPRTSYLDLIQLQAYWSPERLNHHTAPTSLVYGLREALRLVHEEGLDARWDRHLSVGSRLRNGLESIGLDVSGDSCLSIVTLPPLVNEGELRRRLVDEYDVCVTRVAPHTWRVGLLGADAIHANVNRLLGAFEKVFSR